jgi:thioredoxin 1
VVEGDYEEPGPSRAEVDGWTGPAVLEFGANWCGYCQAAQPVIAAALAGFPGVRHAKVADGKGKPLGRSFAVKLWPTLVFLRDGKEVARAVRPGDAEEVRRGLEVATGTAGA